MSSDNPDIRLFATASPVVECEHCGWRGVEGDCTRQCGSLPIEARCPFCRREFICIEADCGGPNPRQISLARCLMSKLSALSFARQGS